MREPESESLAEPMSSTFYRRAGKRILDVSLALGGLIILSPLLAICVFCLKLFSRGPIFYRQARVGLHGRLFEIMKFRTMVMDADKLGPGITRSGDPRVTRFGKFLRAAKIDELPQLWNVLKGDMSMVGPRPEIPEYVRQYTAEQQAVLEVRPGITDLASIVYRDEESALAEISEWENFYRETLLPQKLALNMQYLEDISFINDLYLLFRTIVALGRRDGVRTEKSA